MAELHGRYLGCPEVTDVLSFALHATGRDPVGDIYVGRGQAVRQAAEEGVDAEEEMMRLAVHGTLHVLGYDHPEGPDRDSCEMYRVQEEVLRSLAVEEAKRSRTDASLLECCGGFVHGLLGDGCPSGGSGS